MKKYRYYSFFISKIILILFFIRLFLPLSAWGEEQSRILYVSHREGQSDIYSIYPDGTGEIRITDDPYIEEEPRWSPDGSRIAYLSNRDCKVYPCIWIISPQGQENMRLTNEEDRAVLLGWYDSSHVLFFTPLADGNNCLKTVDINTKKIYKIFEKGVNYQFSPDKKKIAVQITHGDSSGIGIIDIQTGKYSPITPGQKEYSPSWSPDSKKLAFYVNTGSSLEPGVWVAEEDGKIKTRLTSQGFSPGWFPDGENLFFYSRQGRQGVNIFRITYKNREKKLLATGLDCRVSFKAGQIAYINRGELWTVDLNGNNPRRYLNDVSSFQWVPDKSRIFCTRERWNKDIKTGSDIILVDTRTGEITNLTGGGINLYPDYQPRRGLLPPPPIKSLVPEKTLSPLASPSEENVILSDPAWTPDDKSILFAFHIRKKEGKGEHGGIAQLDTDGWNLWTLYRKDAYPSFINLKFYQPTLSPDGFYLVFIQGWWFLEGRNYNEIIKSVDLDSDKISNINPYFVLKTKYIFSTLVSRYCWHPNKGLIYAGFTGAEQKSPDATVQGLWKLSPDGGYARSIIKDYRVNFAMSDPTVSPDGKWLTYWESSGRHPFLLLKRLDSPLNEKYILQIGDQTTPVFWSFDSQRVGWIFNNRIFYRELWGEKKTFAYAIPGTGNQERICPAISPDFRKILYLKGNEIRLYKIDKQEDILLERLPRRGAGFDRFIWNRKSDRAVFMFDNKIWMIRV